MIENLAYFDLSVELLGDLLRLPNGVKIRRLAVRSDYPCNAPLPLRIFVEGEGLPACHPGEMIRERIPIYRRKTVEEAEFVHWHDPEE